MIDKIWKDYWDRMHKREEKKKEEESAVAFSDGLCPVVSLRDYTPSDKIKHVTFSRMEIEQTYDCATCGPLQVVDGVCMHIKPEEEHDWMG